MTVVVPATATVAAAPPSNGARTVGRERNERGDPATRLAYGVGDCEPGSVDKRGDDAHEDSELGADLVVGVALGPRAGAAPGAV